MPDPTYLVHDEGFKVYAPMKIGAQPSDIQLQAMINSHDYLASEKIDGAWFQLMRIDKEHIHLFSRTVSKKDGFYVDRIDNVPHIKTWAQCYLPDNTTLIGEIYVPGGKSNNVTSIMGCIPETAHQRQYKTDEYGGPVHYYVHDVIKYSGEDLLDIPLEERVSHYLYYMLGDCFHWWNGITREGGDNDPYIHLAEYYSNIETEYPEFKYKDFNEYINEVFANGGEGVVFKKRDGIYDPGKRPTYNRKVKEHKDNIDLVVMKCLNPEMMYTGKTVSAEWPYWAYREHGTEQPWKPMCECGVGEWHDHMDQIPVTKPWYNRWKNAVAVGAYDENGKLVPVGSVASGFTDEDRAAMGADPETYVGQVIECACMSVNPQELSLRHPVFIRWHNDKDAKECLLNDIFGG